MIKRPDPRNFVESGTIAALAWKAFLKSCPIHLLHGVVEARDEAAVLRQALEAEWRGKDGAQ